MKRNMPARFAREIGLRGYLRIYWNDKTNPCKDSSYHNSMKHIRDIDNIYTTVPTAESIFGNKEDFTAEQWGTCCDTCGAPVPSDGSSNYQVFSKRLYDTASGELEPGCLFYSPWYDDIYWSNQNTPTLCAILPNGTHWTIDGRASNCTRPDDKTHRCWVRHGNPEEANTMHVDKNGDTCSAGAGSIIGGDWHGFLHHGVFVEC